VWERNILDVKTRNAEATCGLQQTSQVIEEKDTPFDGESSQVRKMKREEEQ
jgi:hypothetical protein